MVRRPPLMLISHSTVAPIRRGGALPSIVLTV